MHTNEVSPLSPRPDASSRDAQIRKVAQEFESLFSAMMLRAMRKTVGDNPLIPQSIGEDIFTGMLDDEYSKMLSSHSSLGLADVIVRELKRQENPGAALEALKNMGANKSWTNDPRFLRNIQTAQDATATKKLDPAQIGKWNGLIERAGKIYGVDKNLIAAVVTAESNGDHRAVSPKGAKGLMQLMDTTAADMGVTDPFSPWANISGGTKYLRYLLDRYNGDEKLAIASYNAGPGAVDRYGTVPPYAETQNYVKSVLDLRNRLTSTSTRETP